MILSIKMRQSLIIIIAILISNLSSAQTLQKDTVPCDLIPRSLTNEIHNYIDSFSYCFRFGAFTYGVEYSNSVEKRVTVFDELNNSFETYLVLDQRTVMDINTDNLRSIQGNFGRVNRCYVSGKDTTYELLVDGRIQIIKLITTQAKPTTVKP